MLSVKYRYAKSAIWFLWRSYFISICKRGTVLQKQYIIIVEKGWPWRAWRFISDTNNWYIGYYNLPESRSTWPNVTCNMLYMASVKKFEWMSFPVIRSGSRADFWKKLNRYSWVLMDEFSRLTVLLTTPKLKFRKKVGWVFQVNGLGHDPEIENFRKISWWVFQDLTIRVKETYLKNFCQSIQWILM